MAPRQTRNKEGTARDHHAPRLLARLRGPRTPNRCAQLLAQCELEARLDKAGTSDDPGPCRGGTADAADVNSLPGGERRVGAEVMSPSVWLPPDGFAGAPDPWKMPLLVLL